MSTNSRKECYALIVSAQHSDSEGYHEKAFLQYLDAINALSCYLKSETIAKSDAKSDANHTHGIDAQLRSGVNTLKNCIDRLQTIVNSLHISGNNNINEKNIDSKAFSQSLVLPSLSSSLSSTLSTSLSPVTSNSYLEKAYKENAFLTKIFEHRFRSTSDPLKRASLELELQRKQTENIQLAKSKDAEKYHEMHLRERRALEEAAEKLLQQQSVFNLDNESIASQQQLYACILQFDHMNEEKVKQFRCRSLSPETKVIKDIMSSLLCDCEHPLAKWLRKFQFQITNRVEPLLSSHKTLAEEKNFLSHSNEDNGSDCLESSCDSYRNEIKINKLESEALERHFNIICADISGAHQTITLMLTLIMFDDKQYYTPENYSFLQNQHFLMYYTVADYIYPSIWPSIYNLFRLVYFHHEEAIKEGMHELYLFNDIKSIFDANIDSKIIEETALSLKSIIPLQSPHSKLKSMVRLMQRLCDRMKSSADMSEVGADQLVPALCLVVLKSGAYSLISECYAIEQLVDPKYLFGEEGYCLSSILTALKYIEINSQHNE